MRFSQRGFWASRGSRVSLPRLRSQYSSKLRSPSSSSSIEPAEPKHSATDHRSVGIAQRLWQLHPASPGIPIFTPDGSYVFQKLQQFLRMQNVSFGFQEVVTPIIYKKMLWEQSGHWQNYKDDMYVVKSGKSVEGTIAQVPKLQPSPGASDDFGLKPMNCPGHCLLFGSSQRSYRELPIRYSDFSPLHRDEVSGALSGLTRVRCFHQDDGHIFCTSSQVGDEVTASLDYMKMTYQTFGVHNYRFVLSTRPATDYIGTIDDWDLAESQLQQALNANNLDFEFNRGDGAFYGPKIDAMVEDSDGKTHQLGTIQLDFQLPQRFNLRYATSATADSAEPESAIPVLIHRAMLGSLERFLAIYIEKNAGKWPFWLHPRPINVLTVTNDADVIAYAKFLVENLQDCTQDQPQDKQKPKQLNSLFYRVKLDESAQPFGKKIAAAKSEGWGILVAAGKRNVADGSIDVDLESIPDQSALVRLLEAMQIHYTTIRKVKMTTDSLRSLIRQMTSNYI